MAMTEHIVAFVDFLGFAEAVKTDRHERVEPIIALLRDVANLRAEFSLSTDQTGHQLVIRPQITTFSDHVVVSYPTQPLRDVGEMIDVLIPFSLLQSLCCRLAVKALRVGMLIRGGATVGQLYHADQVVLGPAMNEAYQLESEVSHYPRVAVSPALDARWPHNTVVAVDADGVHYIDYFKVLVNQHIPVGAGHFEKGEAFLQELIGAARANLQALQERRLLKESSKWAWFARRLDDTLVNQRAIAARAMRAAKAATAPS